MIKPIRNNVLVKLIEKPKETMSGIILTVADRDEVTRGEVIAIGDEVTDVAVGDMILPNWNAARKVVVDGEDFFVVVQDEIVLVFEE